MKVVLFSSQFPTPRDQIRGLFIYQLVQGLKTKIGIRVVCPLPRLLFSRSLSGITGKIGDGEVPEFDMIGGLEVYFPKFPHIPKISIPFHPFLIFKAAIAYMEKIHREERIDLINAHWIYPDGVAAQLIGKKLNIPVILTARGCDVNYSATVVTRRAQIAWALRECAGVTGVSQALVQSMNIIEPSSIEKSKVIYNGIDDNVFYPSESGRCREDLGLGVENKFLLFVGRLHEVKGLDTLIDALSLLQQKNQLNFETVLVGNGPQREEIARKATSLGVAERVRFAGEAGHKQVPVWMRACDLLCLPSKREGMPNVILEALACGTPVIASRVGGIPEVVTKDNGMLIEPGNPSDLAAKLKEAFSIKWDRDVVSGTMDNLTWSRVSDQYISFFRETLKKTNA